MPQNIIIVHAKQTGLHLHLVDEVVREFALVPTSILDSVIATLDAAIEVAPQRGQRIVGVTLEVKQAVPVLVVLIVGTTYPEVITHNLTIYGKVVIGYIVPVGPVQRSVGRGQSLIECLLIGIVFFKRFTRRVLYLQEVIATRCYEEGGKRKEEGEYSCPNLVIYLGFHNLQFSIINLQFSIYSEMLNPTV